VTLRDDIWSRILLKLRLLEPFRIQELGFGESERHTAGRVLREMEQMGWIYRGTEGSPIYQPGVLAYAVFGSGDLEERLAQGDYTPEQLFDALSAQISEDAAELSVERILEGIQE